MAKKATAPKKAAKKAAPSAPAAVIPMNAPNGSKPVGGKVIRTVSTISAKTGIPVNVVSRYATKVPAYLELRKAQNAGKGKVVEVNANVEAQIIKALGGYQARIK